MRGLLPAADDAREAHRILKLKDDDVEQFPKLEHALPQIDSHFYSPNLQMTTNPLWRFAIA